MFERDVRVDWYCEVAGKTYQELVDQAKQRLRAFLDLGTDDTIEIAINIDIDSVILIHGEPRGYNATARCQL